MSANAVAIEPSRLAQARRLRGFLKSELAVAIGVTPAAVSQFEGGLNNPSSTTLTRLAFALRVPPAFLTAGRKPISLSEDETNFRSLRSTTKVQRGQARAQVELLAEVAGTCEQYLRLPAWDGPVAERGQNPEDAANALRTRWALGHGPIANVVAVLEAHGVITARLPASDRVDAFSCVVDGRPYVLLASNKQSSDRSRFDAAHELGHLILHPDALPGMGDAELEAHRFASAFLMPRLSILAELPPSPSLPRLLALKLRWKVSLQALIRRGRDLGIYSEPAYRRAFQRIGVLGWRTEEPGDVGPPEQPELLRRAADLLHARFGDGFLATRMNLPAEDLASLLSTVAGDKPTVVLPETDDVLRAGLIRKLDPSRLANMNSQLAAIVGYILEAPFAEPAIADVVVTHDGFVLIARGRESRANELIGSRADLDRDLTRLLNQTQDLTEQEVSLFARLRNDRIDRAALDGLGESASSPRQLPQ